METTSHFQRRHSFFGVIDDLRDDARNLIHQEIKLAKAELTAKLARFGRDAAYLAVGGIIAFLAVILLLVALGFLVAYGYEQLGFSTEIALVLGFTSIAVIFGIVGAVLITQSLKRLSKSSLTPERTIESLKHIKSGDGGEVPIRTGRAAAGSENDEKSERIESTIRQTRHRIGSEIRDLRERLRLSNMATGAVSQVKSHPVRFVGIAAGIVGVLLIPVWRRRRRRA
jgi:ElaB/YqjD/DUF883 family membrane-anchored ribosome-binding protein